VNMMVEDGNVTELTVLPPSSDRVPITDGDRKGISDPLSAVFVPTGDTGDGLNKETCQRTLPIFDGRQRYDLQVGILTERGPASWIDEHSRNPQSAPAR